VNSPHGGLCGIRRQHKSEVSGSLAGWTSDFSFFERKIGPGMVWYGMVNVDLYSAIITKVSNALNTLVSGEKPGIQSLIELTQ